jgi:hypothetical protein
MSKRKGRVKINTHCSQTLYTYWNLTTLHFSHPIPDRIHKAMYGFSIYNSGGNFAVRVFRNQKRTCRSFAYELLTPVSYSGSTSLSALIQFFTFPRII